MYRGDFYSDEEYEYACRMQEEEFFEDLEREEAYKQYALEEYQKKDNEFIKENIEKIVSLYYNKTDDCTNQFRYDEFENEFNIQNELEEYFKENDIKFEMEIIDGYSSCSYEVSILSIAYADNEDKIHLYTKKLELY